MSDSLSTALKAWSLQGPTLLQSALSAKDAQIARLTAERDAHEKECISLRQCIHSLQSAVDQLAALCTAQVAELAQHTESASELPHPATHPSQSLQRNGVNFTPPDITSKPHLNRVHHSHENDAPDPQLHGQERVCRKESASSSQEPLSRKHSATSDAASAKVGRRASFRGASPVSSNRLSPAVVPRFPTDDPDGEEHLRLLNEQFDIAAEEEEEEEKEKEEEEEEEEGLPPSLAWTSVEEEHTVREGTNTQEILGKPCNNEICKEPDWYQGQQETTNKSSGEYAEGPSDQVRGVKQFIMEGVGEMNLPIFALPGSPFVDVSDAGQCVIKNEAFFMHKSEMPCAMTVTVEPEELDSAIATMIQFEYPDGTMLPFVPVCNLRVKGAHATYGRHCAEDLKGFLNADSYGRDFVRLELPANMFRTLVDSAQRLITDLYPDAILEEHYVPLENSEHVEFFAQLMSPHPVMRGQRWDASVAELLMESESDIVGDGTILMRFLERHGTTELDFVLHRMQLEDDHGIARSVV